MIFQHKINGGSTLIKLSGLIFDVNLKWSHDVGNPRTEVARAAGKMVTIRQLLATCIKRQLHFTLLELCLHHCRLL